MRVLLKILKWIAIILVVAVVGLYLSGNGHIVKGIRSTYLIGKKMPDIDDMQYFDVSTMKADKPEPWPMSVFLNSVELTSQEQSIVDMYETTALLVIKRDTIIFEKYWNGADEKTVSNSFSMAKSMCGTLIGIAIKEGYIVSEEQKVSDFLPQFKEGKAADLTIHHLLQMSSGIPFGESYGNPFGYMAKAYFSSDLVKETMKFKVENEPGQGWVYEGGNTVLLGMIIKAATGRTPSEYFQQKVWSCIGAENDAYWNLDRAGGMEKVFSGFYATARDFAKFGKLYEHNGVLGPDTIINPSYVFEATTPCMIKDVTPEKSTGEICDWYGYQCWLGTFEDQPYFSFRGLRGQYVIVIPSQDLMVVRLGHLQSPERINHMPADMLEYMSMAERICDEMGY